ncbi:PREDICTED: uncharacterized protein LOC106117441 isoform X3 [Papilio xuthus]|uniref:Uncharacterized protein LOC106117441 isoform X3 n=1 Tax=Papilio xuthus TaxID=66420 RepID=A0AAJ6Z8F7_PAPXU|nr:PREDICTED: uncharacterized protein LOC106117441 isoform X3 [Papilio xuthus]
MITVLLKSYLIKWILLYMLLLSALNCDMDAQRSQVEVRAVFIDCEPNNRKGTSDDSDNARFQREELFKHNNLRECKKKLALTVKMTSEPGTSSGDEYIPIEHVFDGSKRKRVRLLDPFVLRLRREAPVQAYKIHRIDTVSGILSNTEGEQALRKKSKNSRVHDSKTIVHSSDSYKYQTVHTLERKKRVHPFPNMTIDDISTVPSYLQDPNFVCRGDCKSTPMSKQVKRQKIPSSAEYFDADQISYWNRHDYNQIPFQDRDTRDIFKKRRQLSMRKRGNRGFSFNDKQESNYDIPTLDDTTYGTLQQDNFNKNLINEFYDPYKMESTKFNQFYTKNAFEIDEETTTDITNEYPKVRNDEKQYAVYEIGNPDLWYTVNIQLYEKLSTPEGKTVWNDITKEDVASVSTQHPVWSNQDMSIQYRPAEWMSHEEFALPKTSLCLLIPIRGTNIANPDHNTDSLIDKFGEFLVLAIDDILFEDTKNMKHNSSNLPLSNVSQEFKIPRRVVIRESRAVMGGNMESLMFASRGSDQYMLIPHRRPHHSQIDVESRADGNQLIHVGSSGRIMTAVSDNTRRTRTALTLQVTNTGLAAARFRVAARDCGPGVLDQVGYKEPVAKAVLIPPKQTQRFLLDLPFEIPDDSAHCYVTLLNDDDESVAVRDVTIKKNDRCFCVWHCKCVCLSVDPKLICEELGEAQQLAAGLSPEQRPRLVRSLCYSDSATLNVCVLVTGVLVALLALGVIKAVLGLVIRCVAALWLDRLVKMPRRLEHYYETSLRYRRVIYDNEGWPVHPDTNKRTVQYISKSMEFILNLLFFIIIPCVIVGDAVRYLISKCTNSETVPRTKPNEVKKIYSGQDIQMRPLLRDDCCRSRRSDELLSSCADSEQDDTEYVLMQMQKSRESLARSQRKLTEASSKSQWKDDMIPSTSKR